MGNPDSIELINDETGRIPFKQAKLDLAQWKSTFRSWPSKLKGYKSWYQRMVTTERSHWEELGIALCLALFVADLKKDESLLSAASYFWSDALNAFLFRQGPMTPTLLDVKLLTGLDILSSVNHFDLDIKCSYQLNTKKRNNGWSGFIVDHMKTGLVFDK